MSIIKQQDVTCPHCGEAVAFDAVHSVNADSRPDLRQAILEGRFQREPCGACGVSFRLDPLFTYLHVARGQWAAVFPAVRLGAWEEHRDRAAAGFDKAFGSGASQPARAIGSGLTPRLVFGWAALEEKLLVAEAGLDDVALELTKIALLRTLGSVPLRSTTELRLVASTPEGLGLAWIDLSVGTAVEHLRVPRELHDQIAEDRFHWETLRAKLAQDCFVDMQRLILKPAAVVEPAVAT